MEMLTVYYPEALARVFVVNMSWLHRSAWAVTQNLISQSALDRVTIVNDLTGLARFFEASQLQTGTVSEPSHRVALTV